MAKLNNTLRLRSEALSRALGSLQQVVEMEKSELARDSAIKRFEYSFELLWKTSKVFLEERFGTAPFSPKECFRALRSNGVVTDRQTELLLRMTDDRNLSVHTYDEKTANRIYKRILRSYFPLMRTISEILKTHARED